MERMGSMRVGGVLQPVGLGVCAHCGQVGNRPGLTVVSVMRTVQVKPPSGDASPQQTALDDFFRSLPTGTILF